MKKRKKNPRGKRPNQPGTHQVPGIEKILTNAVGTIILRQALGNASLVEISAVASLIPNILKAIRSAGPDAAKSAGPQHDPEAVPSVLVS